MRKSQLLHSIARLKNSDVADDFDIVPPCEPIVSTRPSLVWSHDSMYNLPSLLFSAVLLRLLQISFGLYDDTSRKLAAEDPLSLPVMFHNSAYMQICEETRQRKKLLGDLRKLQVHDFTLSNESINENYPINHNSNNTHSNNHSSINTNTNHNTNPNTNTHGGPPPLPPKSTKELPKLPPLNIPTSALPALPVPQNRSVSTPDIHAARKHIIPRDVSALSTTSLPLMRPNPPVATPPASPTSIKYFSYTRPTWLPPKATTDRLKHQRDAANLIERALARESKELAQKVRALEKLQRKRQKDVECWQDILDTISPTELEEKRAQIDPEAWWRGVDPRLRSQVWWKFFYSHLGKFRADVVDMEFSPTLIEAITNDLVYRGAEVVKVVAAYAYYLKGDSKENVMCYYLPQLNDIISTFCIVYRCPYKAFSLVCQMYENGILKLLVHNTPPECDFFAEIDRKFATALPQLYAHFAYQGVGCRDWAPDLVLGLLLPHAGLLLLSQIIDVYLFEGKSDAVLMAAVVALLDQLQYKLYGNKQEILTKLAKHVPLCADHEFMAKIKGYM